MKYIEIGDSVRTVARSAFAECIFVQSVTLGSSLISIGKDAFKNMKLKTMSCKVVFDQFIESHFPDSLTTLKSVTIDSP